MAFYFPWFVLEDVWVRADDSMKYCHPFGQVSQIKQRNKLQNNIHFLRITKPLFLKVLLRVFFVISSMADSRV